jgi:hypothetical protein
MKAAKMPFLHAIYLYPCFLSKDYRGRDNCQQARGEAGYQELRIIQGKQFT